MQNFDFTRAANGDLVVKYLDLQGKEMKAESGQLLARNVSRGDAVQGCYITPAVRDFLANAASAPASDQAIYIANDEIEAWLLTQAGLLAVAMPQREGFLQKPTV